MYFKIKKEKIENIISILQSFLEKKDLSSISSHIYIETHDDKVIMKATDYEMGTKIIIDDANDIQSGKATINGLNLLNIIKRLRNEDIIFETENNNLSLTQNKTNFKLKMYNPEDYPSFPLTENLNTLNVDLSSFISNIKNITSSIDNNNPKFELNGSLIDIKQNIINFVSTDTRRLSISNIDNINNAETKIIIPKRAILEIQKLFLDNVKICYNETYLTLENDNYFFYTKLINGKYPDYERIIQKNFKHTFLVPKDKLIESIKLVTSIKQNVKIIFDSDFVFFESIDDDNESKTQFDIDLKFEESFYIVVNSRYILDFLSYSKNEFVNIKFNDSNLPFELEDNKFKTIIMPIILN